MSENYVAQCPNCRTRFRVSRAQLGAAQGAVRCGACLHVFNAARQIAEAARNAPPAASKPSGTPAPAVTKPASPPPPAAAVVPPAKPEAAKSPPADKPRPTLRDDDLRIHDDLDLGDLDLDQ